LNQFLSFCGTTFVSNFVFSSAVNQNDDAYIKDFIDLIEKEPDVADKLGIFKVVYVRNSDKVNLPKTQSNGFKCMLHHIHKGGCFTFIVLAREA
jgi:hypothetical protein